MAKTATVDMSELLKRLKADRANLIAGGTPDEAVSELEQELGIELPQSYKQFVRMFDGGEFGFGRMHAITPSGAGWFDFRLELERFFESNPRMGVRHVVPFARSYGSDVFCFDMNNVQSGEPAIVMFDGELDQRQDLLKQADSFAQWIKKHYDNSDNDKHWLEVYIGTESELPETFEELRLMQVHESENAAMRCHLQFHPPYVYQIQFTDLEYEAQGLPGFKAGEEAKADRENARRLQSVADLVKQHFSKKGAQPAELFIYDQIEMNSHPKFKIAAGTLPFNDKPIELKAGDRLKLSPTGAIEVIPASHLENHVSRPAERTEIQCNFCGRPQTEVTKLICGPSVQICDICVDVCNEIVNEDKPDEDEDEDEP